MKIISGSMGGQNFDSKSKSTHPMSEKMRGALFNALGDIYGLNFLDLFAGSGALGFEAISRGASHVVAVESNKFAQSDIESNIVKLKLKDKVKLIKRPAASWIAENDRTFDVVLVDPPYDKLQEGVLLQSESLVAKEGVLVLSYPPNADLPPFKFLKILIEKEYGDSRLVFYRNSQ